MELKCLIVYVLSFFNIQVVDWLRATCDVVDDELPIYSAYINHIIRTASALVIRFFLLRGVFYTVPQKRPTFVLL